MYIVYTIYRSFISKLENCHFKRRQGYNKRKEERKKVNIIHEYKRIIIISIVKMG